MKRYNTRVLQMTAEGVLPLSPFKGRIDQAPVNAIIIPSPSSGVVANNGTAIYTEAVLESGVLILEDNAQVIAEIPLAAIMKATNQHGKFNLGLGVPIDWDNSKIQFGATTDATTKAAQICFEYEK